MFTALQTCLVDNGLAWKVNVEAVVAENTTRKQRRSLGSTPNANTKKRKRMAEVEAEDVSSVDETEPVEEKESIKRKESFEEPKTFILLKGDPTSDLAVGIICRVDIARGLYERENNDVSFVKESDEGGSASTGNKSEVAASFPDHCACLLKKVGTTWTVMDCFSVVEFKKDDSSCQDFVKDSSNVDLEKTHGALAQVMSYTVQHVLKHRARRGHLPNYLPWIVIARRRKTAVKARAKKSKSQQQGEELSIRWVSGAIQIPKACGGRFYYTVDDDDSQYRGSNSTTKADPNKQPEPDDRCLSMYLNTLLFGIFSAIKVYDCLVKEKTSKAPLPPPVSASGRKLMIGKVELKDFVLVASSIKGANRIPRPIGGVEWSISQGDLFRGRLNVCLILEGVLERKKVVFKASNKDVDVLVKVSSTMAHDPLITPLQAFAALQAVKEVKKLKRVLYAVIKMDSGLITIMKDLSNTEKRYETMRPEKFKGRLRFLWQGYKELVKDILIPMAREAVVHPDIRPGFDVTANILCKDCGLAKPSLRLIDYESLVMQDEWLCPNNKKYVSCDETWNAMTFVLWQSVAVAYAWHEELSEHVVNVNLMFPKNNQMNWLPGHDLQEQFLSYYQEPSEVSKKDVKEALAALDVLFAGK